MKAEEYLKNNFEIPNNDLTRIMDLTAGDIIDLLTEYAKLKCKEQREICYQTALFEIDCYEGGDLNEILNAPEPEL